MKKITFATSAIPLLWVLLLCCMQKTHAQEQTTVLSGTVKDAGGAPLEGVTVWQKETNKGTQTNEHGAYTLEIFTGIPVVFDYTGYKTQQHTPKGKLLNVTLQPDEDVLDEVVINAGYYSVKDKERTGSISKITAKEIGQQPVANPLAAMQGRMAGVNITQSSGTPGGGFDIQIRGRNSLRTEGNAPLYIVDGVPYASQSLSQSEISAGIMPLGNISPLNSINPNDIESIEVLKDADATAIYGSRGANGVVLITTKKSAVTHTEVSVNSYTSIGTVARFMKLLNTQEYIAMRRQAFANDGIAEFPANAYDINGTWDINRYTNWQKTFLGGKAATQNVQFSINGGSQQTKFLISAGHRNEGTVFPGNFTYKRNQVMANLNHKSIDNKFQLQFSGNYAQQNNNQIAYDLSGYTTLAPNAPSLYDENGNLNWENGTFENPMANLQGVYKNKNNQFNSQLVLNYSISKEFGAKLNLGYNNYFGTESKVLPHTIYNPLYEFTSEQSSVYNGNLQRESFIVEPQIYWNKQMNRHRWEALGGATFEQVKTNNLFVYGSNYSSNILLNDLASAGTIEVLDNTLGQYRYSAVFGRLNYNYNEKYLINVTGRRDGSSRFGSNNRFANFGAVGMAWLFSREAFADKSNWLSFGKLRASYGIAGSDLIGDYQYLDTYNSGGENYEGVIGINPARLYNPDFSWEKNKKLEAAIELSLFNNRLALDVLYFRNKSNNQLVGIPLPDTTGFESVQANLNAEVENSGWEFGLQLQVIDKTNWHWKTTLNASLPKNKLLSFPNLEASTYANRYVIGQPLTIKKVFKLKGINKETGLYEFEDMNGDGLITEVDDRQFVKDVGVRVFGGWFNSLRYKWVTLDFLVQFVKQQNYSPYYTSALPGAMVNNLKETTDFFTENNPQAVFQIPSTGSNNEALQSFMKYRESDAMIVDASYIRLKNVQLGFQLPEKWLGCKATLFVQTQNLFTITKYKGWDPEFSTAGYVPPLRIWAFGFNLIF